MSTIFQSIHLFTILFLASFLVACGSNPEDPSPVNTINGKPDLLDTIWMSNCYARLDGSGRSNSETWEFISIDTVMVTTDVYNDTQCNVPFSSEGTSRVLFGYGQELYTAVGVPVIEIVMTSVALDGVAINLGNQKATFSIIHVNPSRAIFHIGKITAEQDGTTLQTRPSSLDYDITYVQLK